MSRRHVHPTSSRHGSGALLAIGALAAAFLLVSGAYFYYKGTAKETGPLILTETARRGPFEHVVIEQGEVESSKNVEVVCEVKSRNSTGTAILWVVDEGTKVEQGDKLVELDASALEQEAKAQRVVVANARATQISAKSTLDQAEVARTEYLEGTFAQEEKLILSEILVAEENLSRARETSKFSERLAALGFQTTLQLKADQFAVEKATVELELAQSKLKTLRDITKKKMLIQLDADIEAAKAQLEAATNSFDEEEDKLEEIEEQIAKCVIFAPQGGVVVHANVSNSRGGNAEFVVEAGAMVRERQVVIRLPDPSKMQVKANVNEARIPLIREGLPARIQIGAFEDELLQGRVTKVNKYAEPTSWFSSQVKEYATFVEIIDPSPKIRTGMTAEVRIFVQQLSDALQIPVQALYEKKGHLFCLVRSGPRDFETREVKIGAADDTMATIETGLDEGDVVVLNPRAHEEKLLLPDLPDVPPPTIAAIDGPSSAGPAAAAAGGPGAAAGGPGAAGGPAGEGTGGEPGSRGPGGAGGGFNPAAMNPAAMVARTFQQFDTNSDGALAGDELSALPAEQRDRMLSSDANGDGSVDRQELTTAMQRLVKMMQQNGGPGGGPPGGGPPGGAAP